MTTKISLSEAASFLGVSRATLRNWDKEKKLQAKRNPVNGYRTYDLNDVIKMKKSLDSNNHSQVSVEEDQTIDA